MGTIILRPQRDGSLHIDLLHKEGLEENFGLMRESDSLTVTDLTTQTRITLKYTKFENRPALKGRHESRQK